MKNLYSSMALFAYSLFATIGVSAQNPGLLISEFLQNPAGSDSPFEYIELLATDDIDFSATPYTVMVSNNGTATADGWVAGGSLTYAFEITTGTVTLGDVVYVGGNQMTPTGTILRAIDTSVDNGDGGIGDFNASGVVGNGGGNADGIAVFNLPVASLTNASVPTDAVFYGTAIGGAEVNAGADGYQLPMNDLYNGGKLSATSFFAVDEDLTIATGMFDPTTNTFTVDRTFATGAPTATSEISFGSAAPVQIGFDESDITYNEDAGTVSFTLTPLNVSGLVAEFSVEVLNFSTAQNTLDYSVAITDFTIAAGSTTPIEVEIELVDDLLEEQSEYITFRLTNLVNAEENGEPSITIYITDNDRVLPVATNEIKLELLTSFSNGDEGLASAEITAFDTTSNQLFIANSEANTVDFVDFMDPSAPSITLSFNVDSIGAVNGITSHDGVVIVALENLDPQLNGYILFIDADGNWLNRIEVGPMPDMVTLNHAKTRILVANEGEPNDFYTIDPEGSISVIDYTIGAANLTNADVTMITFNSFDGTEAALRTAGVRIFGPGASASQDFEPEYITVLENDEKAFVSLQENNAFAVVNLLTNEIDEIIALGTIDHSLFGFGMDVSNTTSGINIANFPVKGMFMPDAISNIAIEGNNYILSANEGDARDYDGYSEEERVRDLVLNPTNFPDAALLQGDEILGRLKTTTANGDIGNTGEFEEIYTYGTRSFSIWDEDGNLVFDSGDWIEQIIANDPVFVNLFNASNTSLSVKNRSDDKGPEPEGVQAVMIEGIPFAFVSLERIGGVMLFNISDPTSPEYLGYYNNRDEASNGPDKGAEGLLYISSDDSPNGNALLILSNEISSTLTIYQVSTCRELSDVELYTLNGTDGFCAGDEIDLVAESTTPLELTWFLDLNELTGSVNDTIAVDEAGAYTIAFENTTESCMGTFGTLVIEEWALPTPTITDNAGELTTQAFTSYEWFFNGVAVPNSDQQTWTYQNNGDYYVVVTDANGCEATSNTITISGLSITSFTLEDITMAPNPAVTFVTVSAPFKFTAQLMNGQGQVVYSAGDQTNSLSVPVEHLANGIYFMQVTGENKSGTYKLVIQH